MRERINKPRVFLSHARKDAAFIERIENDLDKYGIYTWRDKKEIRDGQPFMETIFEYGIPTCDAVLVYFTDNSVNSPMVKKEIDSALLRLLEDSNVAFLPYVNVEDIRKKLRADIRILQCRVWNEDNYDEILPSVVAEIWRSFSERNIENAVLHEKNKRLELELEINRLNQLQGEDIFTQQEEREFQYIFDKLDVSLDVSIPIHISSKDGGYFANVVGHLIAKISFIYFLLKFIKAGNASFYSYSFSKTLFDDLDENFYPKEILRNRRVGNFEIESAFISNLVTFNLATIRYGELGQISYPFTQNMNRFIFWIEYKEIKNKVSIFQYQEYIEEKN
jgi:hypothetical protein